jgi:hypothetical protein
MSKGFEIRPDDVYHEIRPHLPQTLIDGYHSTTSIDDALRDRDVSMWDPQPMLGSFFLPPFQRPLVWSEEQKISLVESFLLGISIGSIVVVDSMNMTMQNKDLFAKTDRWLLDGQQRLNALRAYREDEITVFAGTKCEHRWSDLTVAETRRVESINFGKIKVHTLDEGMCREIYNRLNFGGTAHTEDQRA